MRTKGGKGRGRGATLLGALLMLFAPVACSTGGGVGPIGSDILEVDLSVSGGIAGVDYALSLDARGVLTAARCTRICPFEEGATLGRFSPERLRRLFDAIEEAGLARGQDRDFGADCCDQFGYGIRVRTAEGSAVVTGTAERLPASLQGVVRALTEMTGGQSSVVVDLGGGLSAWSADPLSLDSVTVSGFQLQVGVSWAGGCETHALDLVAPGDWTAGSPPAIDVFLAHEDFGDACEAYLSHVMTFSMLPLRQAYLERFGTSDGLVRLLLRIPGEAGPGMPVDYVF